MAQPALDLGMPLRTWGSVRVGDIVPQRDLTWHPDHGIGHVAIRMRVTRLDDLGDGVVGVETGQLSGPIHVGYSRHRVDEEVDPCTDLPAYGEVA